MPTPSEVYATSYGMTGRMPTAMYGVHLFEQGDAVELLPRDDARVWLMISTKLRMSCDNLKAASVHLDRYLEAHARAGKMNRDLPEGFGIVLNDKLEVTHRFSSNGRLWPVTYLGHLNGLALATGPCTLDMLLPQYHDMARPLDIESQDEDGPAAIVERSRGG